MVSGLFKKIFGSRNQRLLKGYRKIVRKINQLEPQMQALNDDELRAKTDELSSVMWTARVWTVCCLRPLPWCAKRRNARWACAILTCS